MSETPDDSVKTLWPDAYNGSGPHVFEGPDGFIGISTGGHGYRKTPEQWVALADRALGRKARS